MSQSIRATPLPPSYTMHVLGPADAGPLMRFYNGLSEPSKRTFHPLGESTDVETCRKLGEDNAPGRSRYDLVVEYSGRIVGWSFICGLDGDEPSLGLGIADDHQHRGLGRSLTAAVMAWARQQNLPQVHLTVVQDNLAARRLYESFGFRTHSERVSSVDGLLYCDMTADLQERSE